MVTIKITDFLPCHLTWLENLLMEKLGGEPKSEAQKEWVREYLRKYKGKMERPVNGEAFKDDDNQVEEDEEEKDGDEQKEATSGAEFVLNENNPRIVSLFAYKLSLAAMEGMLGNLEEAKDQLRFLEGALYLLEGDHARLKEVLKYLMEALQECLAVVYGVVQLKTLKETWDQLQNDAKSKAVLEYMKGSLKEKVVLGGNTPPDPTFLNCIRKVVELDPDYFVWRHYAYQRLRQFRIHQSREQRQLPGAPKQIIAPSKEEIKMCQLEFALASEPKPEMVLADYITMLKDNLWLGVLKKLNPGAEVEASPLEMPEDHALGLCLQLLDQALTLARAEENMEETLRLTVQKAELLLYVNSTEETKMEGMELLVRAVEEFGPNGYSQYLHWRLGSLYAQGVPDNNGQRALIDKHKALGQFRKGWSLRQRTSFKCLREYIHTFSYVLPPAPAQEAMDMLTEGLQEFEQKGWSKNVALIKIWRGCFLWFYGNMLKDNKKEPMMAACADWMEVWREGGESRENLLKYLRRPPCSSYDAKQKRYPSQINKAELKQRLSLMNLEKGCTEQEMKELFAEVQKFAGSAQPAWEFGEDGPALAYGQPVVPGAGGFRDPDARPRRTSEADNDPNWRSSGKPGNAL